MRLNISTLCRSTLFDDAVSWNTNRPVFSDCFCRLALAFPAALLLILFIPYAAFVRTFQSYPVKWTRLFTGKLLAGILLSVPPFLDLVKAAHQEASGYGPDQMTFLSSGVLLLALTVCVLLHTLEQTRHVTASAFLFIFYLGSLLVSIPVVYNRIVTSIDAGSVTDVYGLTTFVVYLTLLLIQLVLTCTYDSGLTHEDEVDAAEFRSPIIARLTFSWLDRSVFNAYKKEIGEGDVDQLDPSLRVRTVHGEFARHLPPLVTTPLAGGVGSGSAERRENPMLQSTERVNSDTGRLVDGDNSGGEKFKGEAEDC